MKNHYLYIKWDYHYDKEGTWIDDDSGECGYELCENTYFELPHMSRKKGEILSVEKQGDVITVSMKIDGHPLSVSNNGNPVHKHVSYDYSAAGDSVSTDLYMSISIIEK